MNEKVEKEPTCQVAVYKSVWDELREVKETLRDKGKRAKLQDMVKEAISDYILKVKKYE